MRTHRELDVWKASIRFVKEIYKYTSGFPRHEFYGLASQMRRAAVSIPANISEGAARRSSREFRQFLGISYGSLAELETLLIIAKDLEYLGESENLLLTGQIRMITSQLSGLIHSIDKKVKMQNI